MASTRQRDRGLRRTGTTLIVIGGVLISPADEIAATLGSGGLAAALAPIQGPTSALLGAGLVLGGLALRTYGSTS